MNREERWCSEDVMDHYLGILIERAKSEGNDIQRDTLTMFSLVSIAYSLEYIEYRLVQLCNRLETPSCKKS